mmetsp:Transcript_59203/g.69215  ORF Transcript_59203/g.69215 Transcript_59203/m.69215 type:complete len:299 (+) Transcript_59203:135-1031(+)
MNRTINERNTMSSSSTICTALLIAVMCWSNSEIMVHGFNNIGLSICSNKQWPLVRTRTSCINSQILFHGVLRNKSKNSNSMPVLKMTETLDSVWNAALNTDVAAKQLELELSKQQKEQEKIVAKLEETKKKIGVLIKKKTEYLNGASLGAFQPSLNFEETTLRSIVKAIMWRIIAGSVTFYTAFSFSKSLKTALSIVGSDFLSKAVTMFIGERLMNKSQAGRKGGGDAVGRSLAKALIWRLFAICNTLAAGMFFAKDIKIASKIAGSDAIFKTFLMFNYERVWAKVEWGKEYKPDFYI